MENNIPCGIILPSNLNKYKKNILLKNELHKAWIMEVDEIKRSAIIEYYIKTWGGIRTNSQKTMKEYAFGHPDILIKNGKTGISSWSKALVIHDPSCYAIFDARVSMSLNCIQITFNFNNKVLFPLINSRNNKVKEGIKIIKQKSKLENWLKKDDMAFYTDYLSLLKDVAEKRKTDISTIEMLLFAKAEFLVDKIKNFV
jgi:hypothetical protein